MKCTCVCCPKRSVKKKGEADGSREAECLIDLQVSAHIPEDYVTVNTQRLEVYRRIADIRSHEDSLDVYDELIDRFGEPPAAVCGLIDVALLRNMAADQGFLKSSSRGQPAAVPAPAGSGAGGAAVRRPQGPGDDQRRSQALFRGQDEKGGDPLDTLREALEAMQTPEEPSAGNA